VLVAVKAVDGNAIWWCVALCKDGGARCSLRNPESYPTRR